MAERHIVAIGGSDAGISAALRARELDPTAQFAVGVAYVYPDLRNPSLPQAWVRQHHLDGQRRALIADVGPLGD